MKKKDKIMIKRFDEERPVKDADYEVFYGDGRFIGHCYFWDGEWFCDEDGFSWPTKGTYYTNDRSDLLKMIELLFEEQKKQ